MELNKADLIEQVVWLLEQLTAEELLRVLSLANRLYVTDPPDKES